MKINPKIKAYALIASLVFMIPISINWFTFLAHFFSNGNDTPVNPLEYKILTDSTAAVNKCHLTEIKNISSISNVGIAIEKETLRQIDILENGGTIIEETRRFDETKQEIDDSCEYFTLAYFDESFNDRVFSYKDTRALTITRIPSSGRNTSLEACPLNITALTAAFSSLRDIYRWPDL